MSGGAEGVRPEGLDECDQALFDAMADAGRAIEAMPFDERHRRVESFFTSQDWFGLASDTARNVFVGMLVVAHQRRLFDEAWLETDRAEPSDWEGPE